MALNNSQYNTILRDYDAKQFTLNKLVDARTKEIYKTIRGFKELDDAIINNSMQCARLSLFDNDDSSVNKQIDKLKSDNLDISMQKIELLKEHGYPADYLTPAYECPACKDTGFINDKPCRCFKQAVIKLLYSQDLINKALDKENFDTFRYDFYSSEDINSSLGISPYENIVRVVNKCHIFINDFTKKYDKRSYKNLLIYGNTGVGKTFLANCIAREILNLACSVVYVTASELFDIFAKSSFEKNDDYELDDKVKYIRSCDLLIIDDLGTELSNAFTNSQLYSCINNRILKNLSTVISTNFTLGELQVTYSERILSRLVGEYTMIRIIGNDIRLNHD